MPIFSSAILNLYTGAAQILAYVPGCMSAHENENCFASTCLKSLFFKWGLEMQFEDSH